MTKIISSFALLLFVTGSLACGGVTNPNSPITLISPNSPITLTNATTDFDSLGKWCDRSILAISAEHAANPLRAKELHQKDLKQLQVRLLDQPIRWQFKVTAIKAYDAAAYDPGPAMFQLQKKQEARSVNDLTVLSGWVYTEIDNSVTPPRKKERSPVQVWFQDTLGSQSTISNVPRERLRSLSVGDFVYVVGKVKNAGLTYTYVIHIADAKVE